MSLVALVALQLLVLGALAAASAGLGGLAVARLPAAGASERWAVATATGLGAAGTILFFLGLAGGLRVTVVLALGACGWLLLLRRLSRTRAAPPSPAAQRRDALEWVALPFVGALLLPAFVWSLYPPLAYDATVYHLPFARAFAESHRLVVMPELLFPVFPQLAEVHFAALLLATGADTATHLVQLLAVATTAALLVAAGRRFFSPRAGLWAAALWLAHPLVHYQAASAYVDALFALFALLAVVALERWRETGEAGAVGWLGVAGAAAGWAAATKYHGLLWAVLLVLLALAASPRGRRWRAGLALAAVAFALAAPWYLRIQAATGNPVHPYLAPIFAGGASTKIDRLLGLADGDSASDLGAAALGRLAEVARHPAELARFAWRASFEPASFDKQAPLAPWPLLAAPLAALFARRDSRLARWLLLVLLYAVFWTTTQPRFQLPGAALLALAGAGALEHLAKRFPALDRRFASTSSPLLLALALAAPGPLYAVYKVAALGVAPPATAEARAAFLDSRVVGHAAIRALEARRGARYILFVAGAPELTGYARGRVLGHVLGPYRLERVSDRLDDPAALHRELAAMGADHLLAVGGLRARIARGAPFDRLFRPLYADEGCELFALAPGPPPETGAAPP